MLAQIIAAHDAGHLHRFGVEAQIAAHDADAVIAVAGKVVEGRVDRAEEARIDQRQLDLLQRSPVELLGHLDLETARLGGCDDGVGLAQIVGDGRLQQHVQPMLDRHQADLAIGRVGHRDDADLRLGLAHQLGHVGVPGHAQALAQLARRVLAASPDADQFDLIRQRGHNGAIQIVRPSRRADDGDAGVEWCLS